MDFMEGLQDDLKDGVPVQEVSNLASFTLGVSDEAKTQNYIEREIYSEFKTMLEKTTYPIMLSGETGGGKTFMCAKAQQELAESLGFESFVRIPFDNTTSMRELLGEWTLEKEDGVTVTKWNDALFTESLQKPTLILTDDMSGMGSNKMFILHQLCDSRKLYIKSRGIINMHPKCRLVGALNPHTGKYAGTNKLDASLVNRYLVLEVPQFNKDELNKIIPDSKYKGKLIEFYLKVQDMIRKETLDFEISVRNLSYITVLTEAGLPLGKALKAGFLNSAELTSDSDQMNSALNIAMGVFGRELMNG